MQCLFIMEKGQQLFAGWWLPGFEMKQQPRGQPIGIGRPAIEGSLKAIRQRWLVPATPEKRDDKQAQVGR